MCENWKKCFVENCLSEPKKFCDCQDTLVFICHNHEFLHCELEGNHCCENIYSEIHEETREAALKHMNKLKSDLKDYESKIIETERSLINQIQSITQNALQKLKSLNQKFDEYIAQIHNLKEIDNSKHTNFIESLLNLHPKDTQKIQTIKVPALRITKLRYSDTKNLFILDEFIEQKLYIEKWNRNKPHRMKFIWSCASATLSIFDAKTLEVTKISLGIDKNLDQYESKCLLPDGSLFSDSSHTNPILIGPDLQIKALPSHNQKCSNASAVYLNREIYLIGGILSCSKKYNIDKNIWSKIASLPWNLDSYTVSAAFKNYILIGSSNSRRIFYYDTLIDSFNEISSLEADCGFKGFFVDNEAAYLLVFSKIIYKSKDNLMTWNIVGDCSMLPNNAPIICTPITYKNKIYFANYFGVYSFNLKKNNIKKIITLEG